MLRLRIAFAVLVLFPSLAYAEDSAVLANSEDLAEVEKLLTDALPEAQASESFVDCLGETVFVQRAEQNCVRGLKRIFVVEGRHSIVTSYCLSPDSDPTKIPDMQMYFNSGELAKGWIMTSRRPTRDFLKQLRCQAMGSGAESN